MSRAIDQSLFFGLDRATREPYHVREGLNGEACNRDCPGCGAPLVAVNAIVPGLQRPHFRHALGNTAEACVAASLRAAIVSILTDEGTIITPPQIEPAPRDLFSDAVQIHEEVSYSKFVINDFTDALLQLPGGEVLRVVIHAFDSRPADTDNGRFDLLLYLPDAKLASITSMSQLRQYLTLSEQAWRWCKRQTSPSLLAQDPGASDDADRRESITPGPASSVDLTPAADPLAGEPLRRRTVALPPFWLEDKGGGLCVFWRSRAPSGVMLETIERVPKERRESFIEAHTSAPS